MIPINLGVGLAPDLTIAGGQIYVAFGVQARPADIPPQNPCRRKGSPDSIILVTLTLAGVEVQRQTFTEGFFNSFPRFGGPWLGYKRNFDWKAAALNVQSGQSFVFQGQADGNFGIVVNDALSFLAFQWTNAYTVWLGSLITGASSPTAMTGAPDGLASLPSTTQIVLRKDIRTSVPGMLNPVTRGDLTVGELPNGGMAVQLAGDLLRVALPGQDTPTPSCATDGTTYAAVTGGPQGVRLLVGPRGDWQALPPEEQTPGPVNFSFSHPVILAPFKAAGSGCPDLFTLGNYTEVLPIVIPKGERVIVGFDGRGPWNVQDGCPAWTLRLRELYRYPDETLAESALRWLAEALALLKDWPGDCGVIPMMYDQFNPATGHKWSVAEMLDGLRYLSEIVNLSPRMKVIAPFAYDRANGIVAYPELQATLHAMKAAADTAGAATLLPIEPLPPVPPAPPAPVPAPHPHPAPVPVPAVLPGDFLMSKGL